MIFLQHDTITDPKRVIKSQIQTENDPIRIDVPTKLSIANKSDLRLKRGKPLGSKDKKT